MGYENIALLFWIVPLIFLDNVLTHYQFFLLAKKRFDKPQRLEVNPIARLFMKNGASPMSFICLAGMQYVVVFTLFAIYSYAGWALGVIFGMFVTVNVYHYSNIRTYKVNWDNAKYWRAINARKF